MSLPTSGAISIGTLNGFFGGSGTSMSNFYRGGGRVPATRTVAITAREPSSGEYFNGFNSDAYWATAGQVIQAGFPGQGFFNLVGEGATSFTSGSSTYFRGSYQGGVISGEDFWETFGIFRTFPSTTTVAINTGVPSSGTISLSNFYGAVNS
jgi:hypothetical protein